MREGGGQKGENAEKGERSLATVYLKRGYGFKKGHGDLRGVAS